jgi:hypothetical protein
MSEEQERSAEDLDLEESEAASVAGGMLAGHPGDNVPSEIAGLKAKGYVEEACTTEGTLWVNPKTHHKVTVRGS